MRSLSSFFSSDPQGGSPLSPSLPYLGAIPNGTLNLSFFVCRLPAAFTTSFFLLLVQRNLPRDVSFWHPLAGAYPPVSFLFFIKAGPAPTPFSWNGPDCFYSFLNPLAHCSPPSQGLFPPISVCKHPLLLSFPHLAAGPSFLCRSLSSSYF